MKHTNQNDEYERIAREMTWQVLLRLAEDVAVAADETASMVYWNGELSTEQVEQMRQVVFDFQYATEEYLTQFCADAEPWTDRDERLPSWRPAEETPPWYSGHRTSSANTDSGGDGQIPE